MLKEKIREDMKMAMRAKDQFRLGVLRMILSEISYGETQSQPVDELKSIQKYRKKIADALALATTPQLESELKVVEEYVPRQPTREEVEACVSELMKTAAFALPVRQVGENEKFVFGTMMKLAKEKLPNADGRMVSEILKSKLK